MHPPTIQIPSFPSASSADVLTVLEDIREQLATDPRINAIAYTKQQLSQALNVSQRTIDRWTHEKHDPLPRIRNGQKFLYRREAIIEWLKRHETPRAATDARSATGAAREANAPKATRSKSI
ncbi:MAG: helix-turn-helix domain-containing protein [Candidatus Hydrogenedentes bacterium]|nr:helix-turn-helix domain-containing protein [Candidatus Hydrogenedentota bacterium]